MSGEGTERIAIEGNILDRLEAVEALIQSVINGDIFANDVGNISQLSSRLNSEFIAAEYPGQENLLFITDDTGVPVGFTFGTYIAGTGSGWFSIGQEKEAGTFAIAELATLLATDTFSNLGDRPYLQLTSKGALTLDLQGGSDTATGSKKLAVTASYLTANALQDMLYLDLYTTGTPAAGMGPAISLRAENSNGDLEGVGGSGFNWVSPTDGAEMGEVKTFLKQGGTLYTYFPILGKYIAAGNTTITTSETTLFDQVVPANWLAGSNLIRFTCNAVTVATTARTITWNLYYDDTVIATWTEATGSNATGYIDIQGSLVSTGSNAQRSFVTSERYNATAGAEADQKVVGAATEDTTTAKNVKLTAQLSGAVTSATVRNLVLEYLHATQ